MSRLQNDPLLSPLRLKGLTLRNRIMSTAHAPSYVEDMMPKLRYQLYHEEKAKGGIALTMFGGSSTVDLDSPSAFGQINLTDDRIIPVLRQFSERIHRHGTALMCQITHMGRRTNWDVMDWLPVMAPSPVREPQHRSFPKEMDTADIQRATEAYGQAARRLKEGGIDGVEVLATGHLVEQFWSPVVNHRGDDYGGTFENRMRFGCEVLAEIRRVVGSDYIIGLRISVDEMLHGGLSRDECLEVARYYSERELIDYLNVVGASPSTDLSLSRMIPVMGQRSAPFLTHAAEIRKVVRVPVFHATRMVDVATARHAISEGLIDMVGMTRAHIADPHIVRKITEGREDRIRPCVGAGYCIDRIYMGKDALCIHNPATGREERIPQIVSRSDKPGKNVVIVGGGPAGLEAARVSAERGHRVTLFEAAPRLGGQVVIAANAYRRKELIGVVDWLTAELNGLAVDVRHNTYADPAEVLAENPDIVVIATGGVPNTRFLEAGEELVNTVWDILGGHVKPAGEVLLYDDNGQYPGVTCASTLAQQTNLTLEVVTPDRHVAFEMGYINRARILKTLYSKRVGLTPDLRLLRVERADGGRLAAVFRNEFTDDIVTRTVDHVIVEHGTLPLLEVYDELRSKSRNDGVLHLPSFIGLQPQQQVVNPQGQFQLFRIGDAMASRNLHAAIYDARRLCVVF